MTRTDQEPSRVVISTFTGIGVAIGVVVMMLTNDIILGVIAGSALIAITVGLVRLWTGGGSPRSHHP
jgi:hypothetical protein